MVCLIMWCVSFCLLFLAPKRGAILPCWSLKQGGRISPYLFLLCVDELSFMLHGAVKRKVLFGFNLSIGGPSISHLLFTDDSRLFFKSSKNRGEENQSYSLYVLKSLKHSVLLEGWGLILPPSWIVIRIIWDCQRLCPHNKETLNYIQDRVWSHMKGRLFSIRGKEVLLKAVIQAIPCSDILFHSTNLSMLSMGGNGRFV